jgi:hypothetical protein
MNLDYTNMSAEEQYLEFAKIAYLDGKLLEKEKLLLAEEGRRLGLSVAAQDELLKQAVSLYNTTHN